MPIFEFKANDSRSGTTTGAYSKILAIFNKHTNDNTPHARSKAVSISFKETNQYEDALATTDPSGYNKIAGCDIGAIFMPFIMASGVSGLLMPSLHPNAKASGDFSDPSGIHIRLQTLNPYHWSPQEDSYLYFKPLASGIGDGMPDIVSGSGYLGNPNDYRSPSDIRSIGFRGPMMMAAWGFDQEGYCVPSGSKKDLFKGEISRESGFIVSPREYVAAPIDFRYDNFRHVWAPQRGFWAEILESQSGLVTGGTSGTVYRWRERMPLNAENFGDHPQPRSGNASGNPAFEVNRQTVPSGSIVWMERDRLDCYKFLYGSSSSSVELLKITGDRVRGEVYKGCKVIQRSTPINVNSSGIGFGFDDIGTSGVEVTIFNTQMGNATEHTITTSPQRLQMVFGLKLNFLDTDGRECYLITNFDVMFGCA